MPEEALASVAKTRIARGPLAIMLAAAAALFVIALVMAFTTLREVRSNTDWVEHTLNAETQIAELATLNERIETARRGYLIEPDQSFVTILDSSLAQFDRDLIALRKLISDNPRQTRRAEAVRALGLERDRLTRQLLASRGTVETVRGGGFTNEAGVLLTRRIRSDLSTMLAEEQRLLSIRNQRQLGSLTRFYTIGGLAIALLLALMAAVIFLVTRYNTELNRAQARLKAANEGLEDAVAARTTELSRANAEIQRFAYIVSHDLRSPLVNVLGFTSELDAARKTLHKYLSTLYEERPELKDQAAWLAVEEDLPEALDFIRTSTEKMDRLINSILELSRQGRRQLRPETLDMTALAEGVADTLKQRADAAGGTIALSPLPAITSDRMAVEQILANLVENALKYLSPKRVGEVRVEGRKAGAWVEIDVIDNGRGIAPADHERIFDLFRRAGAQDQAGEGIGLANVRALAYRLGGRVTVDSQLDEGARFTLTLPETFTAAEPS